MVLFNYSTKEITAKVVYYGPGLCGKTTNLQFIYDNLPGNIQRGRMLSLATKTDRTLFFDFLPIDLGTIRGMRTRVQLYTVPGQVFYNSTRRLVLKGADGIVFVADSQTKMKDANLESFHNLEENCIENGINLAETPIVLQFNKRDLPGVASLEELNSALNSHNAPFYETVATTGIGVHETLKAITKLVLHSLSEKYAGGEKPARRPPAPPVAAAPPPTPPRLEEPLALEEESARAAPAPAAAPPPVAAAPTPARPVEEEPLILDEEPVSAAAPAPEPLLVEEPAAREGMAGGGDLDSVFAEVEADDGVEELDLEEDAIVEEPEPAPFEPAAPIAPAQEEPIVEGLLSLAEPDAPSAAEESFADLAADLETEPAEESFADLATDLGSEPVPLAPEPVPLASAAVVLEEDDPLGLGGEAAKAGSPPNLSLGPGSDEIEVPLQIEVGGEVQRYRLRLRLSLTREE